MLKFKLHRFKLLAVSTISLLTLALVMSLFVTVAPAEASGPVIKMAALGQIKPAQLQLANGGFRRLPFFSNGSLHAASSVIAARFGIDRGEMADEDTANDGGSLAGAEGSIGCSNRNPFNDGSFRVNQDCTFRRQAETLIKVNPTNPDNLIAGQNDSRVGFNHCGFDYSYDRGEHWGDGLPPFWSRLNGPPAGHTILGGAGTGHTYDAASDPVLAFDSRGNAFYSCVTFDINSNASGLFVSLSPAPSGGSFYNNVPGAGPKYVVAEDNNIGAFHDKQFMAADSFKDSPFRDNVYITWTVFRSAPNGAYLSSAIYFSRSTDHAQTWSAPKEISGNNPALCFQGNVFDPTRNPSDCDFDQGSDPAVLPDGTLVVVFNNGNTAPTNPNQQQLSVRSTDGGLTWSAPVKVGDDKFSTAPTCDFGRGPEQCIPGPSIRTNDFPRIAAEHNKARGKNVYAAWQDYRFGEYDIIISESTDGGLTWKEATKAANPDKNREHYFPAIDLADRSNDKNSPSQVVISYYRSPKVTSPSQIGTLGQEYFVASGLRLKTPYNDTRAAPMTVAPDGIQAGFNGDYTGLVVIEGDAFPIWSDTRNKVPTPAGAQGVTHDEDVFVRRVTLPAPDQD